MSTAVAQPRLQIAFAGAFAVRLEERVRAHLRMPCDIIRADEVEIVSQLPKVDVLVTMAFTPAMGAAGRRLKLVQVPGAGLDRIDRSALPPGPACNSAERSSRRRSCLSRPGHQCSV